ncbi:2-dehydro-3-deoxy-6-phosphogalactonate aldolase [Microbulbifer salipaludis]|uniref:2-dehydro-3-deoxy-6-phosphogalactonate aldolase n=1 Tax=Microbulbifer salipaludis TaxID=187980 RepID=A0ABS3E7J9_9GAMM|nr:2-dehydro-3-deoxy-6-phosphogalactonate aldolase [Microbulbifer salipaludis]MBN8431288.1 2-dehydro-3-deoxy-6-phosphogalactonate aldolase [Microbulbifer salipaludis]
MTQTAAVPPPLIAILRGVTPAEIIPIAGALLDAGIKYIEVPLNSPNALESISQLVAEFGQQALCGAGTVTRLDEARAVRATGARLLVSPNIEPEVIRYGVSEGMSVFPGFFSPTEAFAAIAAGAKTLKLFPSGDLGPGYIRNLRAVLPLDVQIFAVGGINLQNMEEFWHAGACGFGIGGDLYRPGDSAEKVGDHALQYIESIQQLSTSKQ